MSRRVTIEELAATPRWPLERILALPGLLRGNALRGWGTHVARHWGPGAPDRVRELLGVSATTLPDVPAKRDWLPIWVQLRLAQVIVDEWCGGDMLGFEDLFAETSGTGDKVMRWAAAQLGPTAVLRRAGSYHASVCTVGSCDATADARSARLDFRGADVFGNPTWRLLNTMSIRTMFTFMKKRLVTIHGVDVSPRDYVIEVAWTR
ncbi:MAG: hypothetical protein EP329_20325 [Deltaproteobacteria bacterium]|nr:MAG: hypothetical protein EP329_20325 [Deltaproteobacteria bacterium]